MFPHDIFSPQHDAKIAAAHAFSRACRLQLDKGTLVGVTKEFQGEVLDKCLQFRGGYGFMREHPIAPAYADARLNRIAGGTIEVMKHKDMS
jgi:alkylation response protein AidB-like acyl-CoA dehydrogenase